MLSQHNKEIARKTFLHVVGVAEDKTSIIILIIKMKEDVGMSKPKKHVNKVGKLT